MRWCLPISVSSSNLQLENVEVKWTHGMAKLSNVTLILLLSLFLRQLCDLWNSMSRQVCLLLSEDLILCSGWRLLEPWPNVHQNVQSITIYSRYMGSVQPFHKSLITSSKTYYTARLQCRPTGSQYHYHHAISTCVTTNLWVIKLR